jgi:hypothetical protein
MLRMQEMAFPGFLFQIFSGEVCPHTLLFMRDMPTTHVVHGHCYHALISNG